MATSISTGPAWAMDGIATDASVVRAFNVAAGAYNAGTATAVATRSGVIPGPGAMQVTAPGGMVVTVSAGFFTIAATLGTNGAYSAGLLASGTLTVQGSDPTNPRIDLVCATIIDNGNSTSLGEVQIVTGTPAPSPTVPSLPAQSIPLAQVTVPAGATTIATGNIADQRVWTVTPGGILPVNGVSAVPAVGYPGALCYDLVTGRFVANPAGTAKQPVLLPFVTQSQKVTSPVSGGTAGTTVASVTVTTDGHTDLAIYLKWGSIYTTSGSSEYRAEMQLFIDSTQVDEVWADGQSGGSSVNENGGAYTYYTDAGGTTPSAGSHTIKWVLVGHSNVGGNTVFINAAASSPAILRVAAVPL